MGTAPSRRAVHREFLVDRTRGHSRLPRATRRVAQRLRTQPKGKDLQVKFSSGLVLFMQNDVELVATVCAVLGDC